MSATLPEVVDVWRLVLQRRRFEGRLPLAQFGRLRGSLADVDGEVLYRLDFGRDEFGVAYVEIEAEGLLPLVCQRTLDRFLWPVRVRQRLGLVLREADEAALPSGYEALPVADREIRPADLIEDELILALPLVPVRPDGAGEAATGYDRAPLGTASGEERRDNPFAVLRRLKNH